MKRFHLADEFVDTEAEQGLLVAIRDDPYLYWRLVDNLPEGCFVAEEDLWGEFLHALGEEEPHFPELPEDWELTEPPEDLAKRLADLYQRRLLAEMQERLAEGLYNPEEKAQDLAGLLVEEAAFIQSAIKQSQVNRLMWASDLVSVVLDRAEECYNNRMQTGNEISGVSTGVPGLDQLLNGFGKGLYILSGAPGVGKTTLSLQMAIQASYENVPTIYVTYENSPENLILKALCTFAEVSPLEVEKGNIEPIHLHKAADDLYEIFQFLAILEGSTNLQVDQIRAKALQMMSHHQSDRCLIIFDYLQRAAHGQGYQQLRHNVSALSGRLRDLANRLNSPVLAISSQNRVSGAYGGEGSAALDSLKESGDLEYSADAVIFLLPDAIRQNRQTGVDRAVNLVLAKNRFGAIGKVPLVFRPDVGRLLEDDLM